MPTLAGKTLFITGASRGIGKAIALRAARDGANIVVAAKTAEPHPRLDGTIHTAAAEIEAAGGHALALQVDARDEARVAEAMTEAADRFGGIDIVVNNASAIFLAGTAHTPMKRVDLMFGVNVRGTFCVTQAALPYLEASAAAGRDPHILTLSPPLAMDEKWFAPHVAYTISKFGMSMCVLGWAGEFRETGIAANALWPRTTIATAAVENLLGGEQMMAASRTPAIMADAAHWILTQPARETTGNFFIDDEVMARAGVTDLSGYAVTPGAELMPDFFVEPA
ncbi:MAG TPA: NAD(P)-dependent oxidoreductase [Rubricoccaceae bacterium]|jgi:citronellol/citronellal dehydrogenase